MKTQTFKEIYAELIIRFGEDWETAEIEEKSYPFDASDLLKGNVKIDELFDGAYRIWNKNGLIYDNGTWATRKLTEAPEKWVVKKHLFGHPMWEKFKKWQCENVGNVGFDYKFYNKEHEFDDNLLCFKGHQLITLDQWAEFFLKEEPKAGEWCYFWDDIKHPVIRRYNRLNNTIALYKYIDESEGGWAFCRRLSDEAQVILNREIENIKAR